MTLITIKKDIKCMTNELEDNFVEILQLQSLVSKRKFIVNKYFSVYLLEEMIRACEFHQRLRHFLEATVSCLFVSKMFGVCCSDLYQVYFLLNFAKFN